MMRFLARKKSSYKSVPVHGEGGGKRCVSGVFCVEGNHERGKLNGTIS